MQEQCERRAGGRYVLVELLGRGGMGTVWRARDEVLRRDVALKEIMPAHGAPAPRDRGRALQEARTAARLNHPGAVVVHDVIEDGDRVDIVMELIEAPTLAAVVTDRGPLPPARVAALGLRLLDVLEAAHAAGIVHRDVKPSNVMVLADGRVKLTDFGIACLREDTRATEPGVVLGTPGYLAPEQAQGDDVGPEADLWSLGATLYFAVEGRSPFARESVAAVVAALLSRPPDPMPRAGPLAPVLLALLERDPRSRPRGEDLRGRLQQVADGATTAALPALHPAPTMREVAGQASELPAGPGGPPAANRHVVRRGGAAAALALLAAAVGLGVVLWPRSGPEREPTPSVAASPVARHSAATPAPTGASTVGTGAGASPGPVSSPGQAPGTAGLRALAQTAPAPAGQVLPAYWSSATNTVGGYRVGVPQTWTVTADGGDTTLTWPGVTMFDVAFEVRAHPRDTDPYRQVAADAAALAPADGYHQLRLSSHWTYAGRPASAWEFTWTRNGRVDHGLEVAFRAGGRTYTVLYRSADLWWQGGGTAQFPAGFEQAFTPLGAAD